MLNLSDNHIHITTKNYSSFDKITSGKGKKMLAQWLVGLLLVLIIFMFLPWTQNVQSYGKLTTLRPEQRPQTINSIIAGRIEKWYVREGQKVKKGDTIVFLSEMKDDYFDPNLLGRTENQIKSKELSAQSYLSKAQAIETQIMAMNENKNLKLSQNKNKIRQVILKIEADSIEYQVSKINYDVAKGQYERQQELYKKGIKSLTELETRELKLQETASKRIANENKLLGSRNELLNARIEQNALVSEYADKISKADAERFSSLSSLYDAEVNVTKLQNQYSNYTARQGMYYITAPQDCYITKVIKSGVGETLKEGEPLLNIMPESYDIAAEMYIPAADFPLMHTGNKVRLIFDGWPSIVFSGWAGYSFGTFGGVVVGIDNVSNEKGMYRLLLSPDKKDVAWPTALRVGSGVRTFAMLHDVPIWYELWRKLNGFPPQFYEALTDNTNDKKSDKNEKK